ncbi:MAG: hypothetical protein ACTS2F_15370 [Thainema sp.]
MGLFDQVVSALNNPNQQANPGQLSGILDTVQQVMNGQGMDAATSQTLLSVVGKHVRSALQEKRTTQGASQVEDLVNQYSGTGANPSAVPSIFNPEQEQRTVEDSARATGLNAQTIQSLLPMLIPIVLQFLQSGSAKQPSARGTGGSNSVLNAFLDSDRDGDVDMGDALSVAGQFLRSQR